MHTLIYIQTYILINNVAINLHVYVSMIYTVVPALFLIIKEVSTEEDFQAAWQTEMYNALNFAQFPVNRPLWRCIYMYVCIVRKFAILYFIFVCMYVQTISLCM